MVSNEDTIVEDLRIGQCIDCGNLFMTDIWHINVRKHCNKCRKIYKKNHDKEYRLKNKDKISNQGVEYRKNNKDKIRKRNAEWNDDNREYIRMRSREYYKRNKDKVIKRHVKYRNKRYKNNSMLRLNIVMSASIRQSLNGNKNGVHWEDIVGYTLQDLMNCLESLFQSDMNWDNYGQWHIDHIKPKSLFVFKSYNDEQFKQCWALDNLQPLWSTDNLSKGCKYN